MAAPIIKSRWSPTLVLDSSVLIDLAHDPRLQLETSLWIQATSARVFIPRAALNEYVAPDEERTVLQLLGLRELLRRHGRQIEQAADHMCAIDAELVAPQDSVVTEDWKFFERVSGLNARGVRRFAQNIRNLPAEVERRKEAVYAIDRSLSQRMDELGATPEQRSAAHVCNLIRTLTQLDPTDMWIEAIANRSAGRVSAEVLAANPVKYPVLHALAHLTLRQCLANAVARDERPSAAEVQLLGMFRTALEEERELGTTT